MARITIRRWNRADSLIRDQDHTSKEAGTPRHRADARLGRRSLSALLVGIVMLGLAGTSAVSPVLARSRAAAHAASLVHSTAAHILVTSTGRTLYVFAKDQQNKSACYGQCATNWPPKLVPSGVTPPRKVAGITGTFGVTMRTNGTHQLTYDGAPLYTFIADKKAGDITGQGLFALGGYWWAVVTRG